jgi:hypothetical protein
MTNKKFKTMKKRKKGAMKENNKWKTKNTTVDINFDVQCCLLFFERFDFSKDKTTSHDMLIPQQTIAQRHFILSLGKCPCDDDYLFPIASNFE